MLDASVRDVLRTVIEKKGTDACSDAGLIKALLSDLCPASRVERNVLVQAVQANVPTDMLTASSVPWPLLRTRMVVRLHDEHGMEAGNAEWVVDAWGYALHISPEAASEPAPLSSTVPDASSLPAQDKTRKPAVTPRVNNTPAIVAGKELKGASPSVGDVRTRDESAADNRQKASTQNGSSDIASVEQSRQQRESPSRLPTIVVGVVLGVVVLGGIALTIRNNLQTNQPTAADGVLSKEPSKPANSTAPPIIPDKSKKPDPKSNADKVTPGLPSKSNKPASVPKPTGDKVVPVENRAQIVVDSQPTGATVLVDKRALGKTPYTGSMDLGLDSAKTVRVALTLKGYTIKQFDAPLKSGKVTRLPLVTLKRIVTADTPHPIANRPQGNNSSTASSNSNQPTQPALTRYDLAQLIYDNFANNAASNGGGSTSFADMPPDSPAQPAVAFCQQHGILLGYPDGYYRGRRTVTRYEFAFALERFLKVADADPALRHSRLSELQPEVQTTPPADLPPDSWAYQACMDLLAKGLIVTNADHYYRGKAVISIVDATQALQRVTYMFNHQ